VLDISEQHGGLKIDTIRLEVGAMRNIVPQALEFAFMAASQGTRAESAKLEWKEMPVVVLCRNCQERYKPDSDFWVCPSCGLRSGAVVQGDELILTSIELCEKGN